MPSELSTAPALFPELPSCQCSDGEIYNDCLILFNISSSQCELLEDGDSDFSSLYPSCGYKISAIWNIVDVQKSSCG